MANLNIMTEEQDNSVFSDPADFRNINNKKNLCRIISENRDSSGTCTC